MASAPYLASALFFLVFTAFMTTLFDRSLCPTSVEWLNETTNQTIIETSWTDYVWASKCSGMPSWYKIIIYTPFIAMAIRSIIATS